MQLRKLAELLPEMSEGEYLALRDDIKERGQIEEIIIYRGEVIDGRHRYKACQDLKIEPKTKEWTGTEDDLIRHVLSLNIHRRHLNESQRALCASKLATLKKGRPIAGITALSQGDAAKLFNVSPDSIQCARKVFESKDKALIQSVFSGNMAVSKAAKMVQKKSVIAQGTPRLQQLVEAKKIDINKASEIAELSPEQQAGAIDRTIALGSPDPLEIVDSREPFCKDVTEKTYRIKNSYVQFKEFPDGKSDLRVFAVGSNNYADTIVRGGLNQDIVLLNTQSLVAMLECGHTVNFDNAINDLTALIERIKIAKNIAQSTRNIDKANKKAEKIQLTIDKPVIFEKAFEILKKTTVEQIKQLNYMCQFDFLIEVIQNTSPEQLQEAVEEVLSSPEFRMMPHHNVRPYRSIEDKTKAIIGSFSEPEQEEATQILERLPDNQIKNNDVPSLVYFIKQEFGKTLKSGKYKHQQITPVDPETMEPIDYNQQTWDKSQSQLMVDATGVLLKEDRKPVRALQILTSEQASEVDLTEYTHVNNLRRYVWNNERNIQIDDLYTAGFALLPPYEQEGDYIVCDDLVADFTN